MGEIDFPMWPTYCEEEIQAVEKVLRSGRVNYWTGENGKKFECEFAAKFQCEFGVALANGTVALDAALYSLDIGISDEVIVTSRTFIASASAVVLRGAKPVFADVDLESQNITPQSIEPLISKNTKAIITVHLAGWPCEMLEIMDLAKTHGLFVIEDCAQAHGAVIHNQPIGSWGDVSVFSFCQDKIMSTGGEGGMLLTKSRHLWEKVWSYKDHGKNFDKISNPGTDKGHFRWLHDSFGTNFRMTELQAAIGRIQLGYLPKWLEIRKQNAEYMASCLEDVEALRVPMPPDYVEHANYKFYCFLDPKKLKVGWDRDRIISRLIELGIPCFSGSCSEVYLEKAFQSGNLAPEKALPNAKLLGETSLMFLVHPTLGLDHMEIVCEKVSDVIKKASKM